MVTGSADLVRAAWAKVPEYIAAQLLGFIAGSGVTYGLYRHAISIVEGNGGMRTLGDDGTASYLATYPGKQCSRI